MLYFHKGESHGYIADEQTGNTVAVVHEQDFGNVMAAGPELLAVCQEIDEKFLEMREQMKALGLHETWLNLIRAISAAQ
jgi:hypothetical protein